MYVCVCVWNVYVRTQGRIKTKLDLMLQQWRRVD